MTREEVEKIIRRFKFIKTAIKNKLSQAVFYIGKRKQSVEITAEVETVYEIIELVYKNENDTWIKYMIKLIKGGKTDVFIMQETHCSRSAYYAKKEAFIQKVYNCCIARNLVSFEEILMEKIA